MRRGEVLGLRWSDVDVDAAKLSVRQTVVTVKHRVEFGNPKAAKGRRTVALDAGTGGVLQEHRKQQAEQRFAVGEWWHDYGLVFTNAEGQPCTRIASPAASTG